MFKNNAGYNDILYDENNPFEMNLEEADNISTAKARTN